MYWLYNIVVLLVALFAKLAIPFNNKIFQFFEGRQYTNLKLRNAISETDKVIWMHCASLGEFEQGRPIFEKLKEHNPAHKYVVTFFSPSGYEIRKEYEMADVVCYLPIDTRKNVKHFLDTLHPELAIIVKYEFWPNMMHEISNRNIETILVSGIFRKKQLFFKPHGTWMRKSLKAFSHFFVQDEQSVRLLKGIGFDNVTRSGDTRFDRVFEITNQNNELDFIHEFCNDSYTLVAGSTWKDDEEHLVSYINEHIGNDDKFIIAPHNINAKDIAALKKQLSKKTILYSEKETVEKLSDYQVFIIDTIGILTKIYSYAHVAYVGGGYTKSGVHNVLEPATFAVPIVIGPNYSKFNEVIDLVAAEACFSVNSSQKLSVLLNKFKDDPEFRKSTGIKAGNYVVERKGATETILKYFENERKTR